MLFKSRQIGERLVAVLTCAQFTTTTAAAVYRATTFGSVAVFLGGSVANHFIPCIERSIANQAPVFELLFGHPLAVEYVMSVSSL